jgi:UDP-N-acetylmuramoylalanine--D-glutamate ligase
MTSTAAMATTAPVHSRRKVVVVGLGKTGLSCARWLHARGDEVAVMDSRTTPPALAQLQSELPDVALLLGSFDPIPLAAADEIVVSPGVPLSTPALQAAAASSVPLIGDVELFARNTTRPTIAITGSNGKSTVTTLVGQMLREAGIGAAVGGNLGIPVLDLLRKDADWYVLELSSFQLETTHSLQLHAATVLNLSPDHLDRYPSLEAYGAAKARIFNHAARAIINRDDPVAAELASGTAEQVGFSLSAPLKATDFGLVPGADNELWIARGEQPLMRASEVRAPGRHNLANALAALALAEAAGVDPALACASLRAFPGLPHRSEWVTERHGVRWINDSKGTNPGATAAALAGIVGDGQAGHANGRAVLIAGGDAKGAQFGPLAPIVRECARAVVLIGRDAPLLEAALSGTVPLVQAATMQQAVELAAELAEPGDTVLLSPACASFDMFDDYQHRGRAFAEAALGLAP